VCLARSRIAVEHDVVSLTYELKRFEFWQKISYTFRQFVTLEILDILVLWESGRTQPLGLAVFQSLMLLGIEKGAEKTLIAPFLSFGDLEQLVIFVSDCPEMELPGKVHKGYRLLIFLLHSLSSLRVVHELCDGTQAILGVLLDGFSVLLDAVQGDCFLGVSRL